MIFNSITFFAFLSIVLLVYWVFTKKARARNLFLLVGSYVFYAWTDWRLLLYLVASSLFVYLLGLATKKWKSKAKWFILLGVCQGIGGLFYFKYFNFFIESFSSVLLKIGFQTHWSSLQLIVPLGISFFTFRLLSYLLDLKRDKIAVEGNIIDFFLYVGFFPTLLSGPIDKPGPFLSQLKSPRLFQSEIFGSGLRQILFGWFKKAVIADNCAVYTDMVFNDYSSFDSSTLLLAVLLYSIQIYADFSGYSDMAIGTARLFGINVTKNFNLPFFAMNIADFWRRWHISLTSWLTEYVFTPLCIQFRYQGKFGIIIAVLINFTLIGAWHGANWTYILFGVLHGVLYIPLVIKGSINKKGKLPKKGQKISIKQIRLMAINFLVVSFLFILFRSPSLHSASQFFIQIFDLSLFSLPFEFPKLLVLFILALIGLEWRTRHDDFGFERFAMQWPRLYRYSFYYGVLFLIAYFSVNHQNFIYLQF